MLISQKSLFLKLQSLPAPPLEVGQLGCILITYSVRPWGSSSFEFVPSLDNRATSANGFNESIVTPIPRSSSSPSILKNPPQVVSPNLLAGSASTDPPPLKEPETEASAVQAILQQWAEVKTEYGTVERRYTQCAQTWPLASNVKLENMESAIQLLRQACDYLYNGMTWAPRLPGREGTGEEHWKHLLRQVVCAVTILHIPCKAQRWACSWSPTDAAWTIQGSWRLWCLFQHWFAYFTRCLNVCSSHNLWVCTKLRKLRKADRA